MKSLKIVQEYSWVSSIIKTKFQGHCNSKFSIKNIFPTVIKDFSKLKYTEKKRIQ